MMQVVAVLRGGFFLPTEKLRLPRDLGLAWILSIETRIPLRFIQATPARRTVVRHTAQRKQRNELHGLLAFKLAR